MLSDTTDKAIEVLSLGVAACLVIYFFAGVLAYALLIDGTVSEEKP